MTERVHVVLEHGFEYNDERYYKPESDGGKPVVAYKTEEEANRACKALQEEMFLKLLDGGELGNYERISEVLRKCLEEAGMAEDKIDDVVYGYKPEPAIEAFSTLSDEDKAALIYAETFYEVYEVEIA